MALVPHLAEVDLGRGAEADVDRPPADEPGVATLRVVNGDQSGAGLNVVGTPFLNPLKSKKPFFILNRFLNTYSFLSNNGYVTIIIFLKIGPVFCP